jgi:hypothetical protein
MPTPEPGLRTQVCRADLLRALGLGLKGPLTLEQNDAGWWGYLPPTDAPAAEAGSPSVSLRRLVPNPPPSPELEAATASVPRPRNPLRMPEAWVAERATSREEEEDIASADTAAVLDPETLRPPDVPLGVWHDLVPLPRLARSLAAHLRKPRHGPVDLRTLLRISAARRWPRRLPRMPRRVWPERLIVLLDVNDALFPYQHDMQRVRVLLQGLLPRAQSSFFSVRDGPFGPWRNMDQAPSRYADEPLRPKPVETYLVLSDLGLLRPASAVVDVWQRWLVSAQRCGATCVVLAPIAPEDVSPTRAARARILRWSPDSRFACERGVPIREHDEPSALRALLACLAATSRMDPPLLRALRRCSSDAQNASLEGRLWSHPDVSAYTYASLRDEAHARRLRDFDREAAAMQDALTAYVETHHAHWPLGMRLVERMRQLVARAIPDPDARARVKADLCGLARSVRAGTGDVAAFASTADYVLRNVPEAAKPYFRPELDALAEARGSAIGQRQRWCLLQQGDRHYIVPAKDGRHSGPGVVLCGDLGQAAAGEQVRILLSQQAPQQLLLPAQGALALPPLQHGASIFLGGEETILEIHARTRGVWGWQQSNEGVIEILDLPWSSGLRLSNRSVQAGHAWTFNSRGNEVSVFVGRDQYGISLKIMPREALEDSFMLYPLILFRYLEPGSFLQGSSGGVGKEDERPQHLVTFTRGVWLAETPCNQEVWHAVMRHNPSFFGQGEDASRRPVESVSWNDVKQFLKKLQNILPLGFEAVLPTESQWEYACRAGTCTEYWWGNEPFDVHVNWNEKYGGTTPVHLYPPNPWGLYDMHGNVWEWCADDLREYANAPMHDPEGSGASHSRAVRGGSWYASPARARSAYRGGVNRTGADQFVGFRLALKSLVEPNVPMARTVRNLSDDKDAPR